MLWSRDTEVTRPIASPLPIVIVAGLRLYRQLLTDAFAAHPDFVVVGEASTVDAAVELVRDVAPAIAIIDVTTPGALTLARRIATTKVVAVGAGDAEQDVLACAEAGIDGYVTASASIDDLIAALHATVRGELQCSPRIVASLFRRVASLAHPDPAKRADLPLLTARERQIAPLIAQGLSNKEIAQRLNIEVATVKNHVHHLLGKLGVASRVEAMARGRLPV